MDNKTLLGVTAIVCLAIVSIVAIFSLPDASKLVYAVVAVISGIAGFELKPVLTMLKRRFAKGGK